jgi:hypothetical protein
MSTDGLGLFSNPPLELGMCFMVAGSASVCPEQHEDVFLLRQ